GDPVADDLLELDEAFLRAHLVVERHDLELSAEHAAAFVERLGGVFELVEAVFARRGEGPGQWIDVRDADRIGRRRARGEPGQQCHDHRENKRARRSEHRWPPWGGGNLTRPPPVDKSGAAIRGPLPSPPRIWTLLAAPLGLHAECEASRGRLVVDAERDLA